MGYHRAGYHVEGVDITIQKDYPFPIHEMDAIKAILQFGKSFDLIHASPPCQAHSVAGKACVATMGKEYEDLVGATREALEWTGRPWIMENVPHAPMRPDVILFGYMFGLKVIRQRWFELGGGLFLMNPMAGPRNGSLKKGDFVTVAGKGSSRNRSHSTYYDRPKFYKGNIKDTWRYAMGIDWMESTYCLAQSIPPAYTQYLGEMVQDQVGANRAIS
jgi:DNA (cytosine-5)-methyltransferase 1